MEIVTPISSWPGWREGIASLRNEVPFYLKRARSGTQTERGSRPKNDYVMWGGYPFSGELIGQGYTCIALRRTPFGIWARIPLRDLHGRSGATRFQLPDSRIGSLKTGLLDIRAIALVTQRIN